MAILKPEKGYQMTEELLATECLNLLAKHYPGWTWSPHINATKTGGYIDMECMEITSAVGRPFGIRLTLPTLYKDIDRREIIQKAGFILEFAGLPQKRNDDQDYSMAQFWQNYATYTKELEKGLPG